MSNKNVKNNNTKKNVMSWYDNNSIFHSIDDYNEFMEGLKYTELPVVIQHLNPTKLNTYDITEFSNRVRNNTGYDTEFRFYTCDCCNELQCVIVIDKPED